MGSIPPTGGANTWIDRLTCAQLPVTLSVMNGRNGPPYRNYLSGDHPLPRSPGPTVEPRPGHGTVFVVRHDPDTWSASWQDHVPIHDGRHLPGVADFEGTRDAVLEWARSRPAERHLIFSPEKGDYVPLHPAWHCRVGPLVDQGTPGGGRPPRAARGRPPLSGAGATLPCGQPTMLRWSRRSGRR